MTSIFFYRIIYFVLNALVSLFDAIPEGVKSVIVLILLTVLILVCTLGFWLVGHSQMVVATGSATLVGIYLAFPSSPFYIDNLVIRFLAMVVLGGTGGFALAHREFSKNRSR